MIDRSSVAHQNNEASQPAYSSERPVSAEVATTWNGMEIRRPGAELKGEQVTELVSELGLDGEMTSERLQQFRRMKIEDVADLLDQINHKLQGSEETLLSAATMKVGETSLIPVEHRYDLFEKVIAMLQEAPDNINPTRIGEALGLAVVMLHPFKDGNGRTARAIGYVFHNDYDTSDRTADMAFLTQSRDALRESGVANKPIGYIPRLREGRDPSNPDHVTEYFAELVEGSERPDHELYVSTHSNQVASRTVER